MWVLRLRYAILCPVIAGNHIKASVMPFRMKILGLDGLLDGPQKQEDCNYMCCAIFAYKQ